ncbi:MAG: M23 family metallopeptidase [Bacteroidales bacterium]|nr:M23 family metallopeptidase [Bacteroidales bacterium]
MAKRDKRINNKKRKWYHKLRDKYNLIIFNQSTYEEKLNVRLSRLNVMLSLAVIGVILILITTYIVAFTSLREYIPGYTDVDLRRELYVLQKRADSLEKVTNQQYAYFDNIRQILSGEDNYEESGDDDEDAIIDSKDIVNKRSQEDSLLRLEFEAQDQYSLRVISDEFINNSSIANFTFFTPLKGVISSHYDPAKDHMGVDIVTRRDEAIKATLEGTVILANWTAQTGHVLVIQHAQNLLSVYKHNAVLLKKQGDLVKAGDPIAIVGDSGELSTGPHLHFELWYNGSPVNPEDYMVF